MARLSAASRRTCFSPSHWHIRRGFSFTDPEIVLNPDCVSRRIHILLLNLQGSQSGLTLPSFFYFLTFVNACAVSSQTFSFHCLPHKPSSGWLVSPALGTLSPTFPKPPPNAGSLLRIPSGLPPPGKAPRFLQPALSIPPSSELPWLLKYHGSEHRIVVPSLTGASSVFLT